MPNKFAQPLCTIFISYARKDGRDLTRRLHDDLIKHNYNVWLDTAEIEGGVSWSNEIEAAIDRCNVVLALLSTGSYHSEICRAEQLRSLRKGKRVIPLLVQANSERPLHLEHLNYRDFSEASQYTTMLQTLLGDIKGGETRPLPAKHLTTFNNAPPLPPTFVNRPDEFERLRRAIVGDGGNRQIGLTALRGMGGSGKSVLAAALCWDEVVQAAFPDGIFWVEIGREARELVPRMAQIAAHLGDDPKLYSTLETSQDNLRNLLRSKAALIVLDDVWDARMIDPFKANAPRCRILFTTRDGTIAQKHDAQEVHLGVMTPAESLEFLRTRAGRDDPRLAEIAEHLGHLPLALKLAGAHLSEGMSTTMWLTDFQHVAQIRLGRRSTDPHENLQVCFDLSVERLAEADRPLYYALGIFAQDVAIPSSVIHLLWCKLEPGLTNHDCNELLTDLARMELIEHHPDATLTLHDLLQDYCHAALADQVAATHATLLTAYNPQAQEWPTISHDGYLYYHLIYHLIEAGRQEEVRRLLFDYAWLQTKLKATNANALVADYERLPGDIVVQRLGRTLRQAAYILAQDPQQLVSQLLGRLLDDPAPELQALLRQGADSQRYPWLRPLIPSLREDVALICTFGGHEYGVHGVAVTEDGRLAVSASEDNTLKVWDVARGREVHTLRGHKARVWGVAVTRDGRLAVSASADETLKVWDLASDQAVYTLAGHAEAVSGVAVTGDGHLAVSSSWDKTLKVWDLASGQAVSTLTGHAEAVSGVAVTGDGHLAVSSSWDKTLKVWDLASGQAVSTLVGHTDWVWGVAVTRDGRLAVSASADKTLKVWNLATGSAVHTLAGHTEAVRGVAVMEDGRLAVSVSEDKTLKVWNLATGQAVDTLAGHSREVIGVAVTGDGRLAVSASWDNMLKVWDISSILNASVLGGQAMYTQAKHMKEIYGVAVTGDGHLTVSASKDGTLKVWDLVSGQAVHNLAGHKVEATGVAVTRDGRLAVSASADETLKVWDLATGQAMHTLAGHKGEVTGVAVTGDGRLAVSASKDSTLKVWDLATGQAMHTLAGHKREVIGVAMTGDGRLAVSASKDGLLIVWDLASGQQVKSRLGYTVMAKGVAVTGDGRLAVFSSGFGDLKVWDISRSDIRLRVQDFLAHIDKEMHILVGHTNSVNEVAMTEDGCLAVSASSDTTLKLWEIHTGRLVSTFWAGEALNTCAVASDGVTFVAAGVLGRLHFLRLENV